MDTTTTRTAPLTQAGQTLESSRDSGFDLSAAVGEVVDNSIEAKASVIRIDTGWQEGARRVERIAFADNGIGIDPNILASVLSLGYSSRYNSRAGMGRFGMGLKLASLSQARRVDVYTQPLGHDGQVFHTYLDLDLVKDGTQVELTAEPVDGFPEEHRHLMTGPRNGAAFATGTLVVWSRVDRLVDGGHYGNAVRERLQELTKFLARAYRKFIDQGLHVELARRQVTLHDPLFLMDNPRVIKRFGDIRAEVVDEHTFDVDGHAVHVKVSLLPPELRRHRGTGGRARKGAEDFKDLYIPDNEGKISILRQGREIYYDLVPKLYPGGKENLDRFIGVEVSFPAALDDYFQVRNVKRGAEPVAKLREELREFLKRPINEARKQIRKHWGEVEREEAATSPGGGHGPAMDAVDDAEQAAPQGQAGVGASEDEVEKRFEELFRTLGIDVTTEDGAVRAAALRAEFERHPITLTSGGWPGKELFDVVHLYGKAIVTLNEQHPFMAKVYGPVKNLAAKDPADLSTDEVAELLQKVPVALDVLFMAYAKAENMHREPEEAYGDLRSQWGIAAAAYVRKALDGV